MLVRPFRVFGFAARTSVSPPWFVLSGLAVRSELSPAQVSPLWVWRSHCAVSPFSSAVWSSLSGLCWSPLSNQQIHSSNLASLTEYYPARPSRSAAANQHLSWALFPYSASGIEGPPHAGFTCPLRSAFRVWLPSWRLTPFKPVPVLFHTGGARGINPSELPPRERRPKAFPPWKNPHTVSPVGIPSAEARGRLDRPQFLGSILSRVPGDPMHV